MACTNLRVTAGTEIGIIFSGGNTMQIVRRFVFAMMAAVVLLGPLAGGAAAVCTATAADALPCECPGCDDAGDGRSLCFDIACGAAYAAAPYATVDTLMLPDRTIASLQPARPEPRGIASPTGPPDPPPPR